MASEKEGSFLSLSISSAPHATALCPIQNGVASASTLLWPIFRLSFSTSPGEEGTRVTR
jgi:hypothetical protein